MKQRNTHTVYSVICGHDKSAPTMGARGVNVGVRGCKRWVYEGKYYVFVDKHWLYTVIRSVYSVICGHDKSAPYSGCTWCKRWCTRTIRRRRGRFIARKRWCTWVNITCSWCKY